MLDCTWIINKYCLQQPLQQKDLQIIYVFQDLVSKQNNGLAWALMQDKTSVDRAVDLFNRGEVIRYTFDDLFQQYSTYAIMYIVCLINYW